MKTEILAPAGSAEALVAGVRAGANAVYLGSKAFNARRNAGNFNNEELKEAVRYCHTHGVKVYITVNTLISDSEIEATLDFVKFAMECSADAFIVQDLGLSQVLRSCFPEIRLHASTQMSVLNPEGFLMLERLGFSRAVLPREMSLEEISRVREKTAIELEAFVHGALCMCVSGQCYLSSAIGGRSGNRGLCAQPCRLPFSADDSRSCDLSLKDMSLVNELPKLSEAGVLSFKIEGRMKRPEYVAAAVNACKKSLEHNYGAEDEKKLQSVFSRSGFTNGYFYSRLGKEMFGTRRREDVVGVQSVLKEFSHIYDNEISNIPVDFSFKCVGSQNAVLTASALGKKKTVIGAVPEKAINRPMSKESVEERLAKLGGTPFYLNSINIELEKGLILPASEINFMRREAVSKLCSFEPKSIEMKNLPKTVSDNKIRTPYYTARFKCAQQIPNNHPFKRVFLPIWESNESFIKHKALAEIPRALFSNEEKIEARLAELKAQGVTGALCTTLGGVALALRSGLEIFGDFSLNVYNSFTASIINSPVLSFELTAADISKLNVPFEKGALVYGKIPLMITRNCPVKQNIGCERCNKKGRLTDRKGKSFEVICSPYGCSELLNSTPLYMGDKMSKLNVDFAHFYFSSENASEVERVLGMFEKKEKPSSDFTRGLYFRGAE